MLLPQLTHCKQISNYLIVTAQHLIVKLVRLEVSMLALSAQKERVLSTLLTLCMHQSRRFMTRMVFNWTKGVNYGLWTSYSRLRRFRQCSTKKSDNNWRKLSCISSDFSVVLRRISRMTRCRSGLRYATVYQYSKKSAKRYAFMPTRTPCTVLDQMCAERLI